MATLAAVLATTHHPFYLKATTAPPEQQMPQAAEWKRKVEAYRETLTRAKPEILGMAGADHFNRFFFANFMHQGLLDRGFDFAFSHELKLDHSIICPIITTRPQADLPVVPIYTNIFAPPLPSPKRFWDLGRAIREIIDAYPSDQRIAAVGSGHLSLELGGPRQFQEHGPDPEFDRQAIAWLASGNIEAILEN